MSFPGDGSFQVVSGQLRSGAAKYDDLADQFSRRGTAMQDAFAAAVDAAGDMGVADSLALSADVFADAARDLASEIDGIAASLRTGASNYEGSDNR